MSTEELKELLAKEDVHTLMLRINAEWSKRYHPSASRVVLYVIEDEDANPTRIKIPLVPSEA